MNAKRGATLAGPLCAALAVALAGCSDATTGSAVDEDAGASDELSELRARVEARMAESGIRGWTYAVVRDCEIVDIQTHGELCTGSDAEPVTDETFFYFVESTESVTSAAVLQAAADPAVGLDVNAPIEDAIDFDIGLTERWEEPITWHHLLTFSAGFPSGDRLRGWEAVEGCTPESGRPSIAEHVEGFRGTPAAYPPGRLQVRDRWSLPMAAQVLVHTDPAPEDRRFADIVRARVFEPLGMDRAHHVPSPQYHEDRHGAPGYACSYVSTDLEVKPAAPTRLCEAHQPALNVFLDIRDAAKYAQALACRGVLPDGTRVLDEETVAWMLDWDRGVRSWTSAETRRSAGFYLRQTDVGTVAYHDSGQYGYGAAIAVVPEERFAVVGLTNLRVVAGPHRELVTPALDIFFDVSVPHVRRPEPSAWADRAPLDDYAGEYHGNHPEGDGPNALTFEVVDGGLEIDEASGDLAGFDGARLSPLLPDRFAVEVAFFRVNGRFWRDEEGNVEAYTGRWLKRPLWRDPSDASPSGSR